MMQKSKSLKIRLKEAMEIRGVKVPALSKHTGIPKDRIYAWYRDDTDPKSRDAEILEQWLTGEKPSKNEDNELAKSPGFVPAEDLIQVLKEQNEFLRRNFETSLITIVESQAQAGVQLKTLSWFSVLQASGGDSEKAEKMMAEINNRIAAYEGVENEGDNLNIVGKRYTSGKGK
jgi:hypothetical protein